MGNSFKSIVAAASILIGSPNTPAQEGTNNRVEETKNTLTVLMNELPENFWAAKKVIESDLQLLNDNDLSWSDKVTIEDHLGKLATIAPENARKVLTAINGVETIVAANQVAPLNETKEEKQMRESNLKTVKIANGLLSKAESVTYNTSDTASASLKITGSTRIFRVEQKERKPEVGTNVSATANIKIRWIWPGTAVTYTLRTPDPVPDNRTAVERKTKEVKSVRIIILNGSNEPIDMSWNPDKTFCIKVESGVPQNFIMPPNSIWFTEKIDLVMDIDITKWDYPDIEFRAGLSTMDIVPTKPKVLSSLSAK